MTRLAITCIVLLAAFSLAAENKSDIKMPVKLNPILNTPIVPPGEKKKEEEKSEEEKTKEKKNRIQAKVPPAGEGGQPVNTAAGSASGGGVMPVPGGNPGDGGNPDGSTIKIETKHTKPLDKNAKIYLDFPDTELISVIKFFSEKTGRNFILQDRLAKSKVTVMSPVQVTIEEGWRTFLTLLAVNNISVTQDGKYTIIMNERDVIGTKVPYYKEDNMPDLFKMVATILRFKYVPATEMDKIIKIFRDKGGESAIFDDKTILLIDYASNIKKILEITNELDQPTESDSARLHFVKLNHITPTDAKKLLEEIFKDFIKTAGKQKKQGEQPIFAGIANDQQPQQGPEGQPVQQAEKQPAAEESSSEAAISAMYMQVVADDRAEQLIVLANKQAFQLVLQVIKKIDREIEGEGEIHVLKLQNAKAKDLTNTLNQLTKNRKQGNQNKAGTKGTEVFEGEVSISENEATNSLVIVSSLRDFRNLKKVIEKLDIRRKQVFVEAVIMEVNVEEGLEYGNSFAAGGYEVTIGGEKLPIFFGKAFTNPTPGLVAGLLGPSLTGTENVPGLGALGGVPSLGLLFNAFKNDKNANIVSTPHILTTDNEEAEIVVGDTIPFPSGNIISGTAGSQITYKREDVALKLKIKPQINESGYMTLNVDQDFTEVTGKNEYGTTTSKRSTKTIINAENEQTVVIGGLMKDVVTENQTKIPILGDIPVLGALFKYTINTKRKVNLLIILTPHIVESKEDFDRIYKKKMQEREEFAKKFYGSIRDYEAVPVMDKRRGMLLSMARTLTEEIKNEAEEKERVEKLNRRRATMISPDGKTSEAEFNENGEANTSVRGMESSPEDALIKEEVPSMKDEPKAEPAKDPFRDEPQEAQP